MIGFHASRTALTDVRGDLCITTDEDRAAAYLEDSDGWLHTIEIPDNLRLADEDDLREAAERLWGDVEALSHYTPAPYELADDFDVRAVLAADGFDGIRVFDATHATVLTAVAVNPENA